MWTGCVSKQKQKIFVYKNISRSPNISLTFENYNYCEDVVVQSCRWKPMICCGILNEYWRDMLPPCIYNYSLGTNRTAFLPCSSVCSATRETVCASRNMSRLCLRSIIPVRRPAQEILITSADVVILAQRLSTAGEHLRGTYSQAMIVLLGMGSTEGEGLIQWRNVMWCLRGSKITFCSHHIWKKESSEPKLLYWMYSD